MVPFSTVSRRLGEVAGYMAPSWLAVPGITGDRTQHYIRSRGRALEVARTLARQNC